MKSLLSLTLCLVSLASFNTFASSMNCEVREEDFANDSLEVKSLRLQSSSPSFNMLSAKELVINLFEKEETLLLVFRTPTPVKAVLLLDRAYGRVTKKVNGLLVITGIASDFELVRSEEILPMKKSLVYNIGCKL